VEKYYPRLTQDFQVNKRICDEAAMIPSKRVRNKIAGVSCPAEASESRFLFFAVFFFSFCSRTPAHTCLSHQYVTHLMKRIAKGPVRGISFALQEEERERKDNYVPDESAIETHQIEIDADTKAMLRNMNMHNIGGLVVKDPSADYRRRGRPGDRRRDN
jgi:small subunit ribosomal protein S17e